MTTPEGPGPEDVPKGTDLEDQVRRVIDANLYLVLGTADESGRPWTSPVFYAAYGCRAFYWISSPDVTHSRNLAARPHVSIVIFDSRAPVGTGGARAVYMTPPPPKSPG
jgi:nitroimidazol reductase NimA-like FMN-containing flavoprotein (pyridoxamine 5'-phosphate oxidase superfamily)